MHDMNTMESISEYHRVIALQQECVTDVLRELLELKLSANNVTLQVYLRQCHQHLQGRSFVTTDQLNTMTSPNPDCKNMDVTLLSLVILSSSNNRIGITRNEKALIEKLRGHRNTIAHHGSGRLNDNTLFTEISNDIMRLARSLRNESRANIQACIDELKQRECVRIHSKFEIIEFNKERLQMILIREETAHQGQIEKFNETLLKFNLTKWASHIAREIDVEKILPALRKDGIFSIDVSDEKERDRIFTLLNHLIKDGSKFQVLGFCHILRKQSPTGGHIADLIENNNTDGRDTVEEIKKIEEDQIKQILEDGLEMAEKADESCEDVHIYVEDKLGRIVEFSIVATVMVSLFKCQNVNGRFERITFKQKYVDDNLDDTKLEENVTAMSFQDFAEFVGNQFAAISPDVCKHITEAIYGEAISFETFIDMTEDELKEVFGSRLGPDGYKFGIKKQLKRLQSKISEQTKTKDVHPEEFLRQFDKPSYKKYKRCDVSYQLDGDLQTPAHELVKSRLLTRSILEKNTIRFLTACLNARKNGTVHFGIKRIARNKGDVLGISYIKKDLLQSLDNVVEDGIERCFKHLTLQTRRNIYRCIRPAHIIQTDDQSKVVVEIDIVPFAKHVEENFFTSLFPPNGPQQETFFILEHNDVIKIDKKREDAVKSELKTAAIERRCLDEEKLKILRYAPELTKRLTEELTGGADYITDIFYPIIVVGEGSETHISDYDGFQDAFQNSVAVFDFGASKQLRQKIEEGIAIFSVYSVDSFDTFEKVVHITDKEKPWIYCNGNEEKKEEAMVSSNWIDKRMNPLDNIIQFLKRKIPIGHAKVIFLVFEEAGSTDPMVQFARDAFIRNFKDQCIIIGETAEILQSFEHEILRISNEKVQRSFFTGLSWMETCKVFRKTFKESSDDVCKVPNSSGTFETLTQKEKARWKDIDILSMNECVSDEKQMQLEEQKTKQRDEETKFYQGKKASWWNFYYGHHGERELFRKLRDVTENKLKRAAAKTLVESVDIEHEPGAGGSILGRHLIWHFSQEQCSSQPYRCCVVKKITENTVNEIEQFRGYKDKRPRPVIILLDDIQDGNLYFQRGLNQLAYKTASPGELFGVVINVTRVSLGIDPTVKTETGSVVFKPILKHILTDRERHWFERKFRELEDADVDVDTLIAFNVMRNSFDKTYIKSTVEKILEKAPQNELDILKILSLFGTYEIGMFVPNSVFDSFVGINIQSYAVKKPKACNVGEGRPYGMQQRLPPKFLHPPSILDSHCLSLFSCRAGYEMRNRGLRIISQPLAETIIRYIRDELTLSLEDIVLFVLEHAESQSLKENDESKRFLEAVCSLFKTREDTGGKGRDGVKDKFSRLILAFFDQQNVSDLETGKECVINVTKKCFSITHDAFVGQQLARFYITHMKDFEAAEVAICDSIELCPNNSYLLDTYGQLFKTKFEYIKDNCQRGQKISDTKANEIVELAFKAIEKFQEGQETTEEYERDKINLSCYHMEVRTLLGLLETFESFESFTNEDDFVNGLKNQDEIHLTFLSTFNSSGNINQLVYGGEKQFHAETSLRFVEERDYQVKKVYLIYTEEDVLLLNLRERYERFYRSHGLKYQLKFGYGLKPLMRAFDDKDAMVKELVQRRFREAELKLQRHEGLRRLDYTDRGDLLFYLGFKFIELSRVGEKIDATLYRKLLNYSTKLLDMQADMKRPYLEAFLFFSIFHWPRKNRFEFKNLSTPNTYIRMMNNWDEAFKSNNYIKDKEQLKYYKGKNYFALSKDSLFVIDLYEIELEWREKKEKEEGRYRIHVYKDYFWREPFVADRLKRLTGTLNESGKIIKHQVRYPNGQYQFNIRTFYPTEQLRNREVTFILGFTWSGLRAFDVIEKRQDDNNSDEEDSTRIAEIPDRKVPTIKPKEVDISLYQRKEKTTHVQQQVYASSKNVPVTSLETLMDPLLKQSTTAKIGKTANVSAFVHNVKETSVSKVAIARNTTQESTDEKKSNSPNKSKTAKKSNTKGSQEPPSTQSVFEFPLLQTSDSVDSPSKKFHEQMDFAGALSKPPQLKHDIQENRRHAAARNSEKTTRVQQQVYANSKNVPVTSHETVMDPLLKQSTTAKIAKTADSVDIRLKKSHEQMDFVGAFWKPPQLKQDIQDNTRHAAARNSETPAISSEEPSYWEQLMKDAIDDFEKPIGTPSAQGNDVDKTAGATQCVQRGKQPKNKVSTQQRRPNISSSNYDFDELD